MPGLAEKSEAVSLQGDNGAIEQKFTGRDSVSLADQEKELVLRVLEESLWVQKNAAQKLGISPRALNYKIRKLGITHPHWRKNRS
jgi:transcriptional regulator with GAF, ATPase, and Fis domain